jgi:hypothetical protein
MAAFHSVQTCRWGTPTLFLPWPLWYDASQHEWSCTRGASATILVDPAIRRMCPSWSPAEALAESAPRVHAPDECRYRRAARANPLGDQGVGCQLRDAS